MFEAYQSSLLGLWVILATMVIQAMVAVRMHRRQEGGYMPGILKPSLDHSSIVFRTHRTFQNSLENIIAVLKLETVWLLMIIILCAYFGYKVTDIYSLYASDVMGYDEVNSANVSSLQLYLRPIACFSIGFLADRSNGISWIKKGFFVTIIGSLFFASGILIAEQQIFF